MRRGLVLLAIVVGCASPAIPTAPAAPIPTAPDGGASSTPEASAAPTPAASALPAPSPPKTVPFQRGSVTLSLGDSATSGDWTIKWAEANGTVVTLEAIHRGKSVDRWQTVLEFSVQK